MRLRAGESSILATFHSFPQAEAAKRALREAGLTEVQIDRFGEHGYNPEAAWHSPYHGLTTTIAGVTYEDTPAQFSGADTRPLLAAMPEASGMSGPLTAQGHGVLLTAVVPAERREEAYAIIRRHGGHC